MRFNVLNKLLGCSLRVALGAFLILGTSSTCLFSSAVGLGTQIKNVENVEINAEEKVLPDLSACYEEISALEEEKQVLNAKINKSKANVGKKIVEEISGLRGEISGLRGENSELNEEILRLNEEISELNEKIKENSGLNEEILRLNRIVQALAGNEIVVCLNAKGVEEKKIPEGYSSRIGDNYYYTKNVCDGILSLPKGSCVHVLSENFTIPENWRANLIVIDEDDDDDVNSDSE